MSGSGEAGERVGQAAGFRGWCDRFISYLQDVRGLSPQTVRAYRADLASFASWTEREGVLPATISHRELRSYLADLNRARYSEKTVNRHLSAIRALYRWLVHESLVTQDSAAAIASPKIARTLPKTMADGDVADILSAIDDTDEVGLRDAAILELLYASGARIAEIAGLSIEDIDFAEAQVRLFGKGSKERIVPLYPQVLDRLRTYLQREARQAHADALPLDARQPHVHRCPAYRIREARACRRQGCAAHAPRHAPYLRDGAPRRGSGPQNRPGASRP